MDYLRKVYQLNISLLGVIPEVWRQVRVADSDTLANLHETLQVVMGWTNVHMHMFIKGKEKYGVPDDQFPDDTRNEQQTRLRQVLKKPGDSLLYIYDFGDAWEHRVVLEEVLPYDLSQPLPACCYGERACPPEDVAVRPVMMNFWRRRPTRRILNMTIWSAGSGVISSLICSISTLPMSCCERVNFAWSDAGFSEWWAFA